MREIDKIIVHCTATQEGKPISVSTIDKWHKKRGWSGIGYHYVVQLDGTINRGRPIEKQGAHVWKVNQMQFKKLTGHSYKSARKAFNTTGSIISIPDADIRELMFQTDNTISKHYKDTQAPMMLAKYTKFHSDILIKYRVSEMFEMLRDKVITL